MRFHPSWCGLDSPLNVIYAEIQELRHKSQSTSEESSGDVEGAAAAIDQSLMTLEEKLEALSTGMKSVGEAMDPLTRDASTPTTARSQSESAALLQKHTALVQEWQAVQEESEVLKEELKEDKWLTVFRTVATQADGMMTSLEKGVRRCQVRQEMYSVLTALLILTMSRNSFCRCAGDKSEDPLIHTAPKLQFHRLATTEGQ